MTPLTFLGGAFYSIDMLPPFWRTVSLFNPVVYLVSGFRWSFYGRGDVERRRQPRLHGAVHRGLPGHPVADLPHGLSPQAIGLASADLDRAQEPVAVGVENDRQHDHGADDDRLEVVADAE